jgi:hypothetical protein
MDGLARWPPRNDQPVLERRLAQERGKNEFARLRARQRHERVQRSHQPAHIAGANVLAGPVRQSLGDGGADLSAQTIAPCRLFEGLLCCWGEQEAVDPVP